MDLRYKNNVSNPYYGIGNTTKYNKNLEKANPGYYRFGRKTVKSTSDLQRYLQQNQLRALLGIGLFYTANNTLDGSLFFCNRKIFLVQKEGGPITSSLDLSMIQETMNRYFGLFSLCKPSCLRNGDRKCSILRDVFLRKFVSKRRRFGWIEECSKIDSLVKKLLVNLELRWRMFKFQAINQYFVIATKCFC